MATTPEVKIKISGDPKGFQGAIKTVQGSLKRLGTDLTTLQSLAGKALSFAGIGGAVSVAGLVAAATNLSQVSKEVTILAQVSNVGVEEFQKLASGGRTVGIEQEKLADIFKDVQDKVGDFLETGAGPLADFFENIAPKVGVTAAQFRNLSGPQALQLYVSSLEKANLSQSQFTFFLEAIASDSARLLPLLRNNGAGFREAGDEAERLGGILSEELIAKAAEFEKNLERLRTLTKGVAVDIGSSLLPALNDLAAAFLQFNAEDKRVAQSSGVRTWADTAASAIAFVVDGIDGIRRIIDISGKSILAYSRAITAAVSGDLAGAQRIIAANGEELQRVLDLRLFSRSVEEQQNKRLNTSEVQDNKSKNDQILSAEANLAAGISKLKETQAKQSKANAAEELKGVERLRDALRNAWQASIDGAAKAREDAKALLTQAAEARTGGADAADARRARSQSPEQADRDARLKAEEARSAANFAASSAVIAAFQGRLAQSKKLSDEALKQAGRAEKLADTIINDVDAARLLEQVGAIREDALKAQAQVKEKEAVDLEAIAKAQNDQILKAEERIKALKAEIEKPVNIKTEITAAMENVKTLQAELAKLTDKTITVTVNTVDPSRSITNLDTGQSVDLPSGPFTPGFSGGGFTGSGGKFQPKGIVHAGEYVLRQEVVRQKGMRSLLDNLNMRGISALAQRGYANGSLVGGASPTPINLQWPDGTTSRVSADRAVADEIQRTFRRASLSRGRRS